MPAAEVLLRRASTLTAIAATVVVASVASCAGAEHRVHPGSGDPANPSAVGTVCPPSPIPLGVYEKTITARQAHAYASARDLDYEAEFFALILGTWRFYAGAPDPNCYYSAWYPQRVEGRVVFVDGHPFTVDGRDRVVFHGAAEPDGLYQVFRRPGSVRLIRISDWTTRAAVLEIGRWTLVRAAP
jgi:hypothetical protein